MSEPVTSIPEITPEPDTVVVTFAGNALEVLRDLQAKIIDANNEQDVVLRGIQLLASARGKEVLLRKDGRSEVIRLWS